MQTAIAEMGEHLAYRQNVKSDDEYMQEMNDHLAMLQGVLEEMSNCPMEGMMRSMMHGHSEAGEARSGSKWDVARWRRSDHPIPRRGRPERRTPPSSFSWDAGPEEAEE